MPRPAQRIDPMLAVLRRAWERYPDLRLGQLVGNAARDPDLPAGADYRDPFDTEDDEVWAGLERIASGRLWEKFE